MRYLPLLLIALLQACASLPDEKAMRADALVRAQSDTRDVDTVISNIEVSLRNSSEENMPFYAPLNWKLATDSLTAALKLKEKGAPEAEIRQQLLVAEQAYSAMAPNKQRALDELPDVIEYFKFLQKMGAAAAYPKDYAELISDLRDLIARLDRADVAGAQKDKQSLLSDMRDVEVKTLTFQQLSAADIALDQAEDMDADDDAEQSYDTAEASIKRARQIIKDNPRNLDTVREASRKAYIDAKHAIAVAQEVQSLEKKLDGAKIEPEALERLVLQFESYLIDVVNGMGLPELRYLPLSEQAATLARLGKAIKNGEPVDLTPVDHTSDRYPPSTVEVERLKLPPEFTLQ